MPERRGVSAQPVEVVVASLGAQGDGVAAMRGGERVFVPYGLPGERFRILPQGRDKPARVLERIGDSPDRVAPASPHFGRCGGCALQHLRDDRYIARKLEQLRITLAQRGLRDIPFEAPVRAAPGQRRRARLAAVGRRGGAILGFNERQSHAVVDLAECPVLTPRLEGLLPALRVLAGQLLGPGERLDLQLVEIDGAVDLVLIGRLGLDLGKREAIALAAQTADIARISWRAPDGAEAEPLIQRGTVRAHFAGTVVDLPPGGFVQPTAMTEAALARFVVGEAGSGRVLELYAGAGSFTFPLGAAGARVHAADADGPAIAALVTAAKRAELAGRISAERRDLARRPFMAEALAGYDTVVLDPPRAGAKMQVEAVARSPVPRVVYVSCSAATFARDARILADAGFVIERLLPVVQFLWSPHIEMAAALRR